MNNHGTLRSYDCGCRCEDCRVVKRTSNAKYEAKRRGTIKAVTPRMPAKYVFEEVSFLLSAGMSVIEVSQSLGRSLPSIAQSLFRIGERELSNKFRRTQYALNKGENEPVGNSTKLGENE